MTRKFIMTTAAITALIAAPMAYAETTTKDLTAAEVSQTEAGIGIAEYDPSGMSVTQEEYDVLAASVGAQLMTTANDSIGTITGVGFDGQGNAELAVELPTDTVFEADMLNIVLLPDSVTMTDGIVILDTTVDEMNLMVKESGAEGGEGRSVRIQIM